MTENLPPRGTVVTLHPATPVNQPSSDAQRPLKTSEKMMLAETYLDENFIMLNDTSGYYINRASDALGAEQSQLSLEMFVRLREETCGQIIDLIQLQSDVTLLTEEFEKIDERVKASLKEQQEIMLGTNIRELPHEVKLFLTSSRESFAKTLADRRQRLENAITKAEEDFNAELDVIESSFNALYKNHQAELSNSAAPVCDALSVYMDEIESGLKRLNQIQSSIPRNT